MTKPPRWRSGRRSAPTSSEAIPRSPRRWNVEWVTTTRPLSGQAVGRIDAVLPVAEIIEATTKEGLRVLADLAARNVRIVGHEG